MNERLISDKMENAIKELAGIHLSLSKADACYLKLDGGGCIVFGSEDSVKDLLEEE